MTEVINIPDRELAKDALILQMSQGRDKLAARLDKVLSDRLDLKRSNEALAARVEELEAERVELRGALREMLEVLVDCSGYVGNEFHRNWRNDQPHYLWAIEAGHAALKESQT